MQLEEKNKTLYKMRWMEYDIEYWWVRIKIYLAFTRTIVTNDEAVLC